MTTLHSLSFTIDPKLKTQGKLDGSDVKVNPNGSGFVTPNGSSKKFIVVDGGILSVISLTGVQARAFAQLHESGHKGGRFGSSDIDGADTATHLFKNFINNGKSGKLVLAE